MRPCRRAYQVLPSSEAFQVLPEAYEALPSSEAFQLEAFQALPEAYQVLLLEGHAVMILQGP